MQTASERFLLLEIYLTYFNSEAIELYLLA